MKLCNHVVEGYGSVVFAFLSYLEILDNHM